MPFASRRRPNFLVWIFLFLAYNFRVWNCIFLAVTPSSAFVSYPSVLSSQLTSESTLIPSSPTYLLSKSLEKSLRLRSRFFAINAHKSKSKRQHIHPNNNDTSTEEYISGLLSGIGVQPVKTKNTANQVTCQAHNSNASFKNDVFTCNIQQRYVVPTNIDIQVQLDYARNGHAVLRNFLFCYKADLAELRTTLLNYAKTEELKAWKQKVHVASDDHGIADGCTTIMECQETLQSLGVTESLPFLQYFNTWRHIPSVQNLAFSLGKAASILLDVPTIRLYQDAIFWKRHGDGPTPWHVDARMAPFDTSHMITFWITLQNIPRKDGTGLIFCSKSHSDFALPYWNPINVTEDEHDCNSEWNKLEDRYPKKLVDYMPMNIGDVTVHSGWTLHCSNGNAVNKDDDISTSSSSSSGIDRVALAITFVDGDAGVRSDWENVGDNEDRWSYEDWCKDVKPRTKFTHELVPIVWPLKTV